MIIDSRLEFMDAQAETTVATHLSDNVSDLGSVAAAREIGHGEPIYLIITCDETPESGGSATVQFQLASDAIEAIADSGQSIHWTGPATAFDDISAGDVVHVMAVPDGGLVPYERYLGIQLIIGTAVLTAGSFSAFLSKDPHRIVALPDATN